MNLIKHLRELDKKVQKEKEYNLHYQLNYTINLLEYYFDSKNNKKKKQRAINSLFFRFKHKIKQ